MQYIPITVKRVVARGSKAFTLRLTMFGMVNCMDEYPTYVETFEAQVKLNAIYRLDDEIRRQQVLDDIDRNGYVLKPVQGEKIA